MSKKINVAVMGAAGGIGQPLSLLLKIHPLCGSLNVYDIVNTPGVAADLSHIDTPCAVKAFVGQDQLKDSLQGRDLVIIPAGVPRKPGMTRDDLFNINAGIVKGLIEAIAEVCPNAWIGVISNPVNSTVPIAAEVLKSKNVYNPKKLLGVSTLDVVRAKTFWGELTGVSPKDVKLPVIGGHAGITILPLLSQASPAHSADDETLKALMTRIQNAGTEVVEAKAGAGSATLSMAYAAVEFADACMRAMNGEDNVVECSYVESTLVPDLPFFASPVRLGPEGISEYLPLGKMNAMETENFESMKAELRTQIQKGIDFVNK